MDIQFLVIQLFGGAGQDQTVDLDDCISVTWPGYGVRAGGSQLAGLAEIAQTECIELIHHGLDIPGICGAVGHFKVSLMDTFGPHTGPR